MITYKTINTIALTNMELNRDRIGILNHYSFDYREAYDGYSMCNT